MINYGPIFSHSSQIISLTTASLTSTVHSVVLIYFIENNEIADQQIAVVIVISASPLRIRLGLSDQRLRNAIGYCYGIYTCVSQQGMVGRRLPTYALEANITTTVTGADTWDPPFEPAPKIRPDHPYNNP